MTRPPTLPLVRLPGPTLPDAARLLDELRDLGIVIYRSGPSLRATQPAGRITPDVRAAIAEHRDALLELLTTHPCTACGKFAFPCAGVTCWWCRAHPTPTNPDPGSPPEVQLCPT